MTALPHSWIAATMRSHQITSTITRLIWAGKSWTTLNALSLSLSLAHANDRFTCMLVNFSCIFSCSMVIISVWQTARHHGIDSLTHSSLIAPSLPITSPSQRIAIDRCRIISKDYSQTVNANVVHLTRVHRREKRASHLGRCCCCCIYMLIRFPDPSVRWCSSSNHFSD